MNTKESVAKWRADRERTMSIGWICRDCAAEMGGKWPEGHLAAMHAGECSICQEKKAVCTPYDWQLGRDGQIAKWEPEGRG